MNSKREVMEVWFRRVWAEENQSAIDEMFVPDGHARGMGRNSLIGPKGFKQFHAAFCALLGDIRITIDKSLEEGEWISLICTLTGKDEKSRVPFMMTGHVMARIAGDKITEAYNHWDFMGLYAQLKLLPDGAFEQGLMGQRIV